MDILEAMREVISRGWSNIVFESDSKVVAEAIKSNPQGRFVRDHKIISLKICFLF
jgi:ribonuclease HI